MVHAGQAGRLQLQQPAGEPEGLTRCQGGSATAILPVQSSCNISSLHPFGGPFGGQHNIFFACPGAV